ncbi:MAG: hypothetical protein HN793_01705 [Rhodospirillaceae bacterium]|nr:hypothetical protein [Rhodospirillaceae bacterium]
MRVTKRIFAIGFALCVVLGAPATSTAAPGYDQGRADLEWVMDYLVKWFPGVWDSAPQVWFERNVRMPVDEGEHEHWHRTFARIDAPQIGEVVFYGQINNGGRDGAIIGGSQVLYHAVIDEDLGAVNIFGQGPLNPETYENLHEHPELWDEVQFREREALNCDWIWRRDGNQIFGVLQGNTSEKQAYGPGTCSFISKRTDEEFRADAEWVLTPDQLWLYDNNWSAGMLFLGRDDQTHIRMHRAQPYTCEIEASDDVDVVGHDRGHTMKMATKAGRELQAILLRAEYPAEDGTGRDDRLRLMISDPSTGEALASTDADPLSREIEIEFDGVEIECERSEHFAPLSGQ